MIETTYVQLEKAAATLISKNLPLGVDDLLTAALEGRIRVWALLFEWREYWEWDRRSPDPNDGDGLPKETGEEFFDFVPLFKWHVAALLKYGRVESDVLAESNGFWKQTAGDGQPRVIVTRGEPLYVLASDVERIRSGGDVQPSGPEHPERTLSPREDKSYLNIIGAFLELMLEKKSRGGQRYSTLENQAALIQQIEGHYPHVPGLSERNLQKKFPLARASLAKSTPKA